jgi:hypothetical protein
LQHASWPPTSPQCPHPPLYRAPCGRGSGGAQPGKGRAASRVGESAVELSPVRARLQETEEGGLDRNCSAAFGSPLAMWRPPSSIPADKNDLLRRPFGLVFGRAPPPALADRRRAPRASGP